jgi:hypothetical protein
MQKKETDILTFKNHKGEEKKMTRGEFRNAARYASEHYSHNPDKSHRPENTTPKDRQFQLVEGN